MAGSWRKCVHCGQNINGQEQWRAHMESEHPRKFLENRIEAANNRIISAKTEMQRREEQLHFYRTQLSDLVEGRRTDAVFHQLDWRWMR